MKKTQIILIALLLVTGFVCFYYFDGFDKSKVQISRNDPFKNRMEKSQLFELNAEEDHVIEGTGGTKIVIPANAFLNKKGQTVSGQIKIELKEFLSLDQMILANLTTTSNGDLLESGGMIFLNATQNGHDLTIDKSRPIYIEIPTMNKKTGMQAYKGTRKKNGDMNWTDPKPLEDYLIPIDLNLLDFLPPGFAKQVQQGMPMYGRKLADEPLIDSLYYSFATMEEMPNDTIYDDFFSEQYNEAYDNPNAQIINGSYFSGSYNYGDDFAQSDSAASYCGIDPATIKTIKDKAFQNTFIATKEFEKRLKYLFECCQDSMLELYINNLDKNLCEIDEMVSKQLNGKYARKFNQFASYRHSTIKDADIYAQKLKGFYEQKLKEIKEELIEQKRQAQKTFVENHKAYYELVKNYKKLLWKREKYRMETYGFKWSETGWINVDVRFTAISSIDRFSLEAKLTHNKLKHAYCYLILPSMNSIYRLNSFDDVNFFVGNKNERSMILPPNENLKLVGLGYKDNSFYAATIDFNISESNLLEMTLKKCSKEDFENLIKQNDSQKLENNIAVDQDFQNQINTYKEKNQHLWAERQFIRDLQKIVYPCCN